MQPQQPQQPYYGQPNIPTPPTGPEQYDFIMKYGNKPGGLKGVSGSTKALFGLGGLLVFLLLLWVVLAAVNQGPKASATLPTIAQQQAEMARVMAEIPETGVSQPTRNLAKTTLLNMMTEQRAFTVYMAKHGVSTKGKTQLTINSAATDAQLNTAKTNGAYDTAFISIAQGELTGYETALTQTFATAKLASEQQLLKKAYAEAKLLEQMSRQ